MGGSGRSYSPPSRNTVDCADISFTTLINSPKNLDQVHEQDVLRLTQNNRREISFYLPNGTEVGRLFSSHLLRLSDCMSKGYEYSAVVREVSAELCRVDVSCTKQP